eukprot:2334223-Amphidinium_carterae.1
MPVQASLLPSVTELRALWTTLQVDEDLIGELLHFKLIARGGLIHIDSACVDDENFVARVTETLLSCWSLKTFAASRWCTVGTSTRLVCLALLTGYWETVRHLKGLGRFPQYEFNALVNLELASVRSFICTASVASVLAEHMLLSVMRDNRVARRANSLRSSVASDHLAVEGLPDFVVDVFGSLLQISGKAVRHMLLTASCTQLCFLEHRVWSNVTQIPWCFCEGDISGNVRRFVESAPNDGVESAIGNRLLYLAQVGLLDQGVDAV